MDRELVQHCADRVMGLIRQDMDSGLVPRTVGSFSELHEFVDANGYADDAGVPQPAGDYELVNAVETRVSEMLGQASGTTPT